ncbi:hypothetical protein [Streptomyces sp. NPDC002265]|uniref:hypothetical protein n=1 Tax=Streptomyces sp. NPDC002265 TaxID=3154415 RepID=UPI0033166C55
MNVRLTAGGSADAAVGASARQRHNALRTELPRVRAAALAWRNGVAGLLAGLVGFSAIRGRSEIDKVATPWDVVAGGLLLGALTVGVAGALWALRACHGPTRSTPVDSTTSAVTQDHVIAEAALLDLRRGIAGTLLCGALLVGAIAVTWYAPARSDPRLRLQIPGAVVCGTNAGTDHGTLTLDTDAGPVRVNLAQALTIQAVATCP